MVNRNAFLLSVIFCIFFAISAESQAAPLPQEEVSVCLGCHENKEMSLKFKNGDTLSLYVDYHALLGSAHKNLGCSGCHGFSAGDHPDKQFKDRRSFIISISESCKR